MKLGSPISKNPGHLTMTDRFDEMALGLLRRFCLDDGCQLPPCRCRDDLAAALRQVEREAVERLRPRTPDSEGDWRKGRTESGDMM
jgi:hypothetical protein